MALYDDQALLPEQQAPPQAAAAQPAAQPAPAPAASPEPGSETKPMPAAQEPSYGVGAAIVDAISHRLGFGTPIRSIENQRLLENSQRLESERSQALLNATRMKEAEDEFTKVSAPVFLAVGKPEIALLQGFRSFCAEDQ